MDANIRFQRCVFLKSMSKMYDTKLMRNSTARNEEEFSSLRIDIDIYPWAVIHNNNNKKDLRKSLNMSLLTIHYYF